ncbi:MAG TPA: hypothetical protein VFG65_02465 [Fimbriimonadales bacterium]|nr:hypothetical protein [Fimbriimonadales bacterium]
MIHTAWQTPTRLSLTSASSPVAVRTGPIPSPYFPEPITVPDNVADGPPPQRIRFVRDVGLLHLGSLLALFLLALFWLPAPRMDFLARLGADGILAATAGSLLLLAVLRSAPVFLQIPVILFFLFAASGAAALWAPFFADEFPDYAEGFLWAIGSSWFGLYVYTLFAGRDYSFFGIYVLTLIFTALSLAVFTIATDIVMSQGFAIFVVVAGMLFFWVYDLAMILRRRKPKETIAAALDLYRDTLNFIGYPVRIMRMPRGRKRIKF